MDALSDEVRVMTVGLKRSCQQAIEIELRAYPDISVEHHPAWAIAALRADVVIVEADSGRGKEAIDMLTSFRGPKMPMLVMYSEDEEMVASMKKAAPKTEMGRVPPGFCNRLKRVLTNVQCHRPNLSDSLTSLPDVSGSDAEAALQAFYSSN